ncbi:hypothetical protein HKD37_05G012586 [Glycine soja]
MKEEFVANKPPMFKGANYDYWKKMMISFFESTPIDMWDVVEKGNHIPLDAHKNEIHRDKWKNDNKSRFLLNSSTRNALLCALSQEEYSKAHDFRSAKQIWDTLAITYEGSSKVKHNKLSLLTCKYELFSMEEGEDIQTMFGCFQTILSELCSLELVGILKVHEQELAQDEGIKKGKLLALIAQRPKCNFVSKESSSIALVVDDTSKEESNDDDSDEEDEELSLITRKIKKMWKNKNSSRFKSSSKRSVHKKEKSPDICYECKKLGYFKSECSDLEKLEDKKKKFFKSKKKNLMSTWEDLDDSSCNEDNEEEANLCLMADVFTSKIEPALDASLDDEDPQTNYSVNFDGDEVIFESREYLIKGYNQLLFAFAHVSKAYRKLNKCFQNLERQHGDLKKIHQAHLVDFVLETTSPGDVLFVRRLRHYWMKRYLVDERFFLRIFKTWKKG